MVCKIDNCRNKYLARGFCSTHYKSEIYIKEKPLYHIWQSMVARCHKSWSSGYKYYGGRGIKVCDRWRHSYKNFTNDMGERPGPGYSIDRINNDGDYEPGNCRWATNIEQRNNQRDPKLRVDNKFGTTGIKKMYNGKYQARAGEGGRIHLGTFNTIKEAAEARTQWIKAKEEK